MTTPAEQAAEALRRARSKLGNAGQDVDYVDEALAALTAEAARANCPEVARTPEPEERAARVSPDREALARRLDGLAKTLMLDPNANWAANDVESAAAALRLPAQAEVEEMCERLSYSSDIACRDAMIMLRRLSSLPSAVGEWRPTHIMIGPPPHRMVAAFDAKGQQVGEWQGPLADVLHRLAPTIDRVEIIGERTYTPAPPQETKP